MSGKNINQEILPKSFTENDSNEQIYNKNSTSELGAGFSFCQKQKKIKELLLGVEKTSKIQIFAIRIPQQKSEWDFHLFCQKIRKSGHHFGGDRKTLKMNSFTIRTQQQKSGWNFIFPTNIKGNQGNLAICFCLGPKNIENYQFFNKNSTAEIGLEFSYFLKKKED